MYYLIGKSLKHSLSEYIHHKLSSIDYSILELDCIDDFFRIKDFLGINVTIPYKEEVIRYLDYLDPLAKKIGAVNTVVNRDGKLYGYNTDYDGFKALLKRYNVDVFNKRVLVLGTGGSSKTVSEVLKDLSVESIHYCSRDKSKGYTYDEVLEHDFEVVINTTPSGMYPSNDSKPLLDLNRFTSLEAVVDLIYNPLTTSLLESTNVKKVNGLYMLVYQAYVAHKHFLNQEIDLNIVEEIYNDLLFNNVNIVLIGMPMSGKSTIGFELSKLLNKEFVDIDNEIENRSGKSIPELFEISEEHFRNIESKVTADYAKEHNLIISTGGGVILREENIRLLKQNGIIIFLDRPLKDLIHTESLNRPLIKSKESIIDLYNARIELYRKYSDIIMSDVSVEEIYEAISSKWG